MLLITGIKLNRFSLSTSAPFSIVPRLTFDTISYKNQTASVTIRKLTVSLVLKPRFSYWITIAVTDPSIEQSAEQVLSATTPQKRTRNQFNMSYVKKKLCNYKNGGLLQLLLQSVRFTITNGKLCVIEPNERCAIVNTHINEISLSSAELQVKGILVKVFPAWAENSANLHCDLVRLLFNSNDNWRTKPYNSHGKNVLFGRARWIVNLEIQKAIFYTGQFIHRYKFRASGIDIKYESLDSTEKIEVEVENPINIKYCPELQQFIERFSGWKATYQRERQHTAQQHQPAYPADHGLDIKVTLGKIFLRVDNGEIGSCVLVHFNQLTIEKTNGETELNLIAVTAQMTTERVESEYIAPPTRNKNLLVDKITIKHNTYLPVDGHNPIVKSIVHAVIRQIAFIHRDQPLVFSSSDIPYMVRRIEHSGSDMICFSEIGVTFERLNYHGKLTVEVKTPFCINYCLEMVKFLEQCLNWWAPYKRRRQIMTALQTTYPSNPDLDIKVILENIFIKWDKSIVCMLILYLYKFYGNNMTDWTKKVVLLSFGSTHTEPTKDNLFMEKITIQHRKGCLEINANDTNIKLMMNDNIYFAILQAHVTHLQACLSQFMPSSSSGKQLHVSINLYGKTRCMLHITPKIKILTGMVNIQKAGKVSVFMRNVWISVGWFPTRYYSSLYIASVHDLNWKDYCKACWLFIIDDSEVSCSWIVTDKQV